MDINPFAPIVPRKIFPSNKTSISNTAVACGLSLQNKDINTTALAPTLPSPTDSSGLVQPTQVTQATPTSTALNISNALPCPTTTTDSQQSTSTTVNKEVLI